MEILKRINWTRFSCLPATVIVDCRRKSVPRKVEKVSQNVDMDTLPVCFGDFKKCNVNFYFI